MHAVLDTVLGMVNGKGNFDNPEDTHQLEEWINRKTGIVSSRESEIEELT